MNSRPPLRDSFLKHYPENMIEDVLNTYREHNHKYHDKMIEAMPHAVEVIKYLKENDYEIAIVSSKMRNTVMLGLDAIGLKDYFEVVVGCEDVKKHKPYPDALLKACELLRVSHDDVIYVGDTVGDIKASKNMGAYSIAYISNDNLDDMAKAKPCRIIKDLIEIKDIVKEDREWNEFVI